MAEFQVPKKKKDVAFEILKVMFLHADDPFIWRGMLILTPFKTI